MVRENYTEVLVTLVKITPKAVLLNREGDEDIWVPRSLIHGGDETRLDEMKEGEEVSLRIMEWKVKAWGDGLV